jgi:hypothetical protein
MRFIFDNNLSPRLAKALNALREQDGDSVAHLRERGLDSVPDEEYIRQLAQEDDWTVVTCDIAISRKPHQVQAWLDSGLIFVILKKGWISLDFWKKAWKLIKLWREIRSAVARCRQGSGITVPVSGSIQFLNLSGSSGR